MIRTIILLSSFSFLSAAGAQGPGQGKGAGPGMMSKHMASCSGLKTACEKAGYTHGGRNATSSGKGLIRDCMGKVANGEKVEGLELDLNDPSLATCKADMASFKDMRDAHRASRQDMRKEMRKARQKMMGRAGAVNAPADEAIPSTPEEAPKK